MTELPSIDFTEIAEAQRNNPELLKCQTDSFLQLKSIPIPTSDTTVICDISISIIRQFIPSSFQRIVFNALHSLSHPGTRCTIVHFSAPSYSF